MKSHIDLRYMLPDKRESTFHTNNNTNSVHDPIASNIPVSMISTPCTIELYSNSSPKKDHEHDD